MINRRHLVRLFVALGLILNLGVVDAQVSIGGTAGFNGSGSGLTISANSTTSTSSGSILYASGDGITTITGGVNRSWTKSGDINSYDLTTLTFTNGSQSGSGSSNKTADNLGVTGTFSLTFTPTGGALTTLGTFNFTLDAATGSGQTKATDQYTFGLQNAVATTTTLGTTSFTQAYSSSFVTGSTLVSYTVYGNSWANQVIAETNNSSINVGFQITNIQPIPEPGTYALAGPVVLLGAIGLRRLKRKSKPAVPAV